jgi:hypothetical protein
VTGEIQYKNPRPRVLRRSNRLAIGLLALACSALPAAAQTDPPACRAVTTGQTNVLVELFTSEGCNSCPPADHWLSALGKSPAVPGRVVPIAWHVDYWDYIGWKDRFAQAAFSERQHRLAQIRRERVVYTPQMLLQGRDFRRWSLGGFDRLAADIQALPARARIALSIGGRSNAGIEVAVDARLLDPALRAAPTAQALYIAATASGLSTEVRAGENAGRRLAHDYVAFGWRGPIPFGPDGVLTQRHRLALPPAASAGVVAFVQSERTAEVVQALMLPVCPG